MKKLSLLELGHAITSNRDKVIESLLAGGILVSRKVDDERLMKILSENVSNEKVNAGIWELVKKLPYLKGCPHCEQREL